MSKLLCRDYGFECSFETSSADTKIAIDEFQKHSSEKHHIEYSEGSILQLIFQKSNKKL